MGELATRFGGKISGELIREGDWNGLIDGIEAQLTGLETRVNGRIAALEPRIAALDTRLTAITQSVTALTQSLTPLQTLAASLLDRQRRIALNATRTAFAIGERAEIVARVTDLLGAPLNLASEAARPWIDFVTVWGTLKAAPGFASVAGTGGRTVTVQVNASGEARVLLRAEAGIELAEEQELEVSAVLGTNVGPRNVARAFLDAPTPGSTDLAPAFAAVTAAYQRADTAVMRNYIDATYLAKPSRSYTPLTQAFAINWRDEHATVLAFMKPDDKSDSPDGAMAVGSIRVTFRDWIYPWIMTHFMPVKPEKVGTYRDQFRPKIRKEIGIEKSVSGVWEVIQAQTKNIGILGAQREFAAAQEALKELTLPDASNHLAGVVQAVGSGLSMQRSLAYGQAVAPLVLEDVTPAMGVSIGLVRGEGAAATAVEEARGAAGKAAEQAQAQVTKTVGLAEARILDLVRGETAKLKNEVFDVNGPVRSAQNIAVAAKALAENMNRELEKKAPMTMVSQLINVRNRPT